MPASVLVGAFVGRRGWRGGVTDLISGDFVLPLRRCNAGHTVIAGDTKLALHQVPSGVMYENTYPVIGNGCIIIQRFFCSSGARKQTGDRQP